MKLTQKKNHDTCMKALSDAGIYVLLDLSTPEISIPRNNPYWDTYFLDHFKLKVDAFSIYDNILGFVAGNNVTVDINTVPASAFVKASIRDVKTYLKYKNIKIPVGYSGVIDYDIAFSSQRYFSCGNDPLATTDFYGFIMRGRDTSNDINLKSLSNYIHHPSFISEGPINRQSGSDNVNYLYNIKYKFFSGGFLFEYSDEDGGYGLVDVNYGNSSVNKLPIYESFKSYLSQDYNSGYWPIDNTIAPPPNTEYCDCLSKTFSCQLPPTFNQTDTNQFKILNDKISDLCKNADCSEILTDAKTKIYGKLSGCTIAQKASYVLSLNFVKNNNSTQQCAVAGLNQTLVINSSALNISSCDRIAGANVNVDSILDVDQINYTSYDPYNSRISSGQLLNNGNYKYALNTIHLTILAIILSITNQ
ncbi:pH-responsive protein 1 [Smittium culicis]|uniref:1,3-beta-glucanosyltransferase n=1 Tax=Smittium culicis TaxID=133412 RepID=A0A1R1XHW2_9FUNG|nr:pH-responsive protein 1 [Smittium culicis]